MMAFPLDQGLQLDSPWSSDDLYLESSLDDHKVSGQLVLDKISLEISVSLSRLISCSKGVRVFVFSVTLRRHRKLSSLGTRTEGLIWVQATAQS